MVSRDAMSSAADLVACSVIPLGCVAEISEVVALRSSSGRACAQEFAQTPTPFAVWGSQISRVFRSLSLRIRNHRPNGGKKLVQRAGKGVFGWFGQPVAVCESEYPR